VVGPPIEYGPARTEPSKRISLPRNGAARMRLRQPDRSSAGTTASGIVAEVSRSSSSETFGSRAREQRRGCRRRTAPCRALRERRCSSPSCRGPHPRRCRAYAPCRLGRAAWRFCCSSRASAAAAQDARSLLRQWRRRLPDAHRRRDVADPVRDRRQHGLDGPAALSARSRLRRGTRPENPLRPNHAELVPMRFLDAGMSGNGHSRTCRAEAVWAPAAEHVCRC
jgi:hypothetical protein